MSTPSPAPVQRGRVAPYLNFEGRCEEALEFYKKSLGAQVIMLMRFKDSPQAEGSHTHPQIPADKVMHSTFMIRGSTLHGTDGFCSRSASFSGINLSLSLPTAAEARATFDALADEGAVEQPLTQTFFSEAFGMVRDRFGVCWMIVADPNA